MRSFAGQSVGAWRVVALATLGSGLMGPTIAEGSVPQAVATTAMVADVAQNVAGQCLAVTTLMGPGVDPHLYQPSAGDVRSLQNADVILFSGYALEGQLGDVLEALGERQPTLGVGPAAIDPSDLIAVQDVYGVDPHLWMDASLWGRTAPVIAATFAEVAPDCAAPMQANAEAYQQQMEALDAWIEASIASIPEEHRVLVTAHDAFAYYGRAYGIEVEGIQGISTEAEAGIGDIRGVIDRVVELGVPALFVETTINPRTVQAVIDGAAERGHDVVIGGELYSDAMGAPDTAEGTYVGMLRANTLTIVEALGGTAAAWPDVLIGWAERWSLELADR